jgi:hypothetical protein
MVPRNDWPAFPNGQAHPGNDSSIGYRKENGVQPLINNLGPGNALWTLEQGSIIVQLHGGR